MSLALGEMCCQRQWCPVGYSLVLVGVVIMFHLVFLMHSVE